MFKNFALIAALLFATNLLAETAREVVESAHKEAKSTGSMTPFMELFDLGEIYDSLSEQERAGMSKEQFITIVGPMMKDPIAGMRKMMEQAGAGSPQMAQMMEQQIAQQQAKLEEQIRNTDNEVVSERTEGEDTILKIKSTYQGEVTTNEVRMRKKDGDWKIVYADLMDQINSGAVSPLGQ